MIQECLCALAVDESDDVSSTSQDFLECLFSQNRKTLIERDAADIFIRLIFLLDINYSLRMVFLLFLSMIRNTTSFKFRHLEKLPKVVLSNEESNAVLHAQQLLTIIFYSGPRLLVDHLQSPVCASTIIPLVLALHFVFLDTYME